MPTHCQEPLATPGSAHSRAQLSTSRHFVFCTGHARQSRAGVVREGGAGQGRPLTWQPHRAAQDGSLRRGWESPPHPRHHGGILGNYPALSGLHSLI